MSTPIYERDQYSFPAFAPSQPSNQRENERRSSDEDGTLHGEAAEDGLMDHHDHDHTHHEDSQDRNHLRVTTSYVDGPDRLYKAGSGSNRSPMSPSAQREAARRLDDDLAMLQAERVVSNAERARSDADRENSIGRSKSMARSRSRNASEPVDDFDVGTTPIHEKTKIYQPPANPSTRFAKVVKRIHGSSFLVRYFCYISPVVVLLLIPLLFGLLLFKRAAVGGVKLFWFGIWLEIVWLTLWAARILAKMIPWPMGTISSLFTNNSKKWRDLGKALEVPATLFFWWLAIEISFLPTMKNHHLDGNKTTKDWEVTVNKIIVSIFVGAILNFIEKIIIQLIAISFHLRTYADRIEVNKFQISSLVKLYIYSKEKIAMEDAEFEDRPQTGPSSGARTPMLMVQKAQKNARHVFNRVGDVAAKVGGDFTGRAVTTSTHPHQVILQLLNSTTGSQVLARRLYRTFAHEDSETVFSDDLRMAFDNDDEADAAFTMFDKDLNGDISMEELEAVCVEIGRERKAITASLKDLDSVISKLDNVFLFVVFVITILVFVSLISTSAQTALTSLGSTVLALSWLFSATAQEFLQSLIFVFVKHPFDVGDRVTIYGNTGSLGRGDDYFVKEISLLYTEFKKMEGHVVQAPNSYLNTLFILNQRRSGGLAEAVPVTVKFGTTLQQIETLRNRLLEFVTSENREYQKNILTELTTIFEAYSITLNVVFFYKSNWQNELLRLQRRNKFICAMMVTMQELGIEGPRLGHVPGAQESHPVFLHTPYPTMQNPSNQPSDSGPGPRSGSLTRDQSTHAPFVAPSPSQSTQQNTVQSHPSILRHRSRDGSSSRMRGESISQMGKRVDFSLGMQGISSGADFGDVYEDRKVRLPDVKFTSSSPGPGRASNSRERESRERDRVSEEVESLGRSDRDELGSRDAMGKVTSQDSRRTHRNRFFSRARRGVGVGAADEGVNLDDLEAGTRDISVGDMPDIPEASGANSAVTPKTPAQLWSEKEMERVERGEVLQAGGNTEYGRPLVGKGRGLIGEDRGIGSARIDPRSGIVSPQAVASDSALERGELPMIGLPVFRPEAADRREGEKRE